MLQHLLDEADDEFAAKAAADATSQPKAPIEAPFFIAAGPTASALEKFVPQDTANTSEILNGKINTEEWLSSLGVDDEPEIDPALQKALAQQAFGAISGAAPVPPEKARDNVLALRAPDAVKKVVAMLTAYDWQFIDQAKEIRSYIVATLLEESQKMTNKLPDRLKALRMLGDVTEIGLFTQRIEISSKSLSDEEIEQQIKQRLEKMTIHADVPLVERVNSETDDGS